MRTLPSPIEPPSKSEVHLWVVRLIAGMGQINDLRETLSGDEKHRADAFRFEKHSNAFLIARVLLRAILGWYLELPPEDVAFQYGPQGKPALCAKVKRDLHSIIDADQFQGQCDGEYAPEHRGRRVRRSL